MQSSPWRLQCPGGEGTEYLTVTRIYSDESGESRFGSFRIQMKGSGNSLINLYSNMLVLFEHNKWCSTDI